MSRQLVVYIDNTIEVEGEMLTTKLRLQNKGETHDLSLTLRRASLKVTDCLRGNREDTGLMLPAHEKHLNDGRNY